MKITDSIRPTIPVTQNALGIPAGQVFQASVFPDGALLVWYRCLQSIACLSDSGKSYSGGSALTTIFYNYKPREAELILR